jgi:GxxExxY protein
LEGVADRPTLRASSDLPEAQERTGAAVIESALLVHRLLGPGLLETVYESCLADELERRGHGIERQVVLPVVFRGVVLDAAFRIDLRVDRSVIVEVKAVEAVLPIHRAQLLSYLKLTGIRLGLLLNFNRPTLRGGIHRLVV